MKITPTELGRYVLFLITVSHALACDGRAPLVDEATAPQAASPSSAGTTTERADAGSGDGRAVRATADLQQQVMSRWNATVDAGHWTIDFHWSSWNNFPHPTFKFGTAEAYGQFAEVLLAFFQRGDDFDFLSQNHLFTIEIRADTTSGQGDVITSFEKLADYFSSSTAFGDITPDVRSALAEIAPRIHQTS